jgi:hypothetical protein
MYDLFGNPVESEPARATPKSQPVVAPPPKPLTPSLASGVDPWGKPRAYEFWKDSNTFTTIWHI